MQSNSRPIEFGLFDWIDFVRPETLGALYEQRFRLLEYADGAGFFGYHLAEHHLTPLGGAPSPAVFLAAASQRTRRIRLGALVFVLPLYHPIRLAQEICMLDHLTGGRLEVGWGRGASPLELGLMDVDPGEAREIDAEAFDVLIEALATGGVKGFEGKHLRFGPLDLALRPLQHPYPPLWHPVTGPERAAWLGSHGVNTIIQSLDYASVRSLVKTYEEAWHAHEGGERLNGHVRTPRFGLMRQVYLAESHDAAMREAKAAHAVHSAAFLGLWRRFGEADRYSPMKDFELQTREGGLLIGTPGEVTERIAQQLADTGINYFMSNFSFGDLSDEQVLRSAHLFATEVMPHLASGATTLRFG